MRLFSKHKKVKWRILWKGHFPNALRRRKELEGKSINYFWCCSHNKTKCEMQTRNRRRGKCLSQQQDDEQRRRKINKDLWVRAKEKFFIEKKKKLRKNIKAKGLRWGEGTKERKEGEINNIIIIPHQQDGGKTFLIFPSSF
jgi:hypothetical protein